MIISNLPAFIDEEIYDEDLSEHEVVRFYLTLLTDNDETWSAGYSTNTDCDMAIPELIVKDCKTLYEAAYRLRAKVERFNKLS